MVETMTVHKALVELKVLDDRIQKGLDKMPFVVANKHSNAKIKGEPIGTYVQEMTAAYQSVADLISRRTAIKKAITMSNAVTKVEIADKEYTVADAIEMKNHGIPLKRMLLKKLNSDFAKAKRECDDNNGETLEIRADDYVQSLFTSSDAKGISDEIAQVRAAFIEAQTYELVDPIGIVKEIEAVDEEINQFLVDIDSALSVSNALTTITIEY